MKRVLTVSSINKKPYIRILGNYLKKFNFKRGDRIEVKITENQIVIEKVSI